MIRRVLHSFDSALAEPKLDDSQQAGEGAHSHGDRNRQPIELSRLEPEDSEYGGQESCTDGKADARRRLGLGQTDGHGLGLARCGSGDWGHAVTSSHHPTSIAGLASGTRPVAGSAASASGDAAGTRGRYLKYVKVPAAASSRGAGPAAAPGVTGGDFLVNARIHFCTQRRSHHLALKVLH